MKKASSPLDLLIRIYRSSRTLERTLNGAIVHADLSQSFEEYLEVFGESYAGDLEVGRPPLRQGRPHNLKASKETQHYEPVSKVKGRIDIVFADAGVGEFVPFGAVTEEHSDKLFDSNVRGTLFTVQ